MRHFFLRISKLLLPISLVSIMNLACANANDLPDLARYENERGLSNPSYILGQYWFRKINGSAGLIEFPPAYNYLREAVASIVPNTGLYDKTIDLALLNSTETNAFVIPGNHLFIYSDILRLINNESTLMGLLAHEVSHLELHHYQRSLENQKNEQAKALLLVLAGVAAATAGDGETTSALWLGGMANQVENMLSYSRAHEQEADRRGRELMQLSGFPTSGMNELLAGLFKQSLGSNRIEFLSTHPLPQNRLSDSLTGQEQTSVLFTPSSDSFRYFRATLLSYRAALEGNRYRNFLSSSLTTSDEYHYGLALAELLMHYNETALENINKVQSRNEFVDYLKTIIYLTVDQDEQAKQVIEDRLALAPNDLTFTYLAGQVKEQKPYLRTTPDQLGYEKRMVYRHNIAVARQRNNQPYALYNHALLQFELGKDKPALNLINRAIKQSSGSDRSEMESMKTQLELLEDAQRREDLN